jgi:hypothetical protein
LEPCQRHQRCLTLPSRGRRPASRAPPLMSNVRRLKSAHRRSIVSESSNNGVQLALLASALGILAVVAALYFLFPSVPTPTENQYGRTEEALRDEYNLLLRKSGLSTEHAHCVYYPKSLTLTCEAPPLKEASLFATAVQEGWKTGAPNKSGSVAYAKARYALSMTCPTNRATKPCEVTLQARASTGA